jgi:rRNA maturation RNase YbeY
MLNIRFYNSEIGFLPKATTKLRGWLNAVAKHEGQQIKEINYIFCSDEYLYKMNLQFLGHDDYTDVITFENTNKADFIEGEVYISYHRIKENAKKYNLLIVNELHRVMVHGLLHLLGYKDKTPANKKEMTTKEDFYLNLRVEFNL